MWGWQQGKQWKIWFFLHFRYINAVWLISLQLLSVKEYLDIFCNICKNRRIRSIWSLGPFDLSNIPQTVTKWVLFYTHRIFTLSVLSVLEANSTPELVRQTPLTRKTLLLCWVWQIWMILFCLWHGTACNKRTAPYLFFLNCQNEIW